ncbi:2-oxo-3-deoxygalactonate kinase [Sphingomonas spermidinifaciens]|uniref:2-oxo-3-deoxygalactonate kinase n=1 Tax=Sphingomonas spermidinifaciens TaxID=1141889 RepID=A0A2A4B585_9SPHN|nr:2-dehydro-3-deoxygalactonokinase [Sphingomonas spermidinifaciens]PCD03112.1 2-oxo-3-deoxygalactonate kinase [Sphingomonas spermidinifaciens]
MSDFIAVDWGTTNRRAWRVEDGRVADMMHDGHGILAVPAGGFVEAAAAVRARLGSLPMLMAGMVGSNRGWADAGYVPCPATLDALAAGLRQVADDAWIVPGVSTAEGSRGDVMRGEEVQLLGAVAAGLAPADALMCQPGTHCKWARIERGALVSFATAMTGELFALLRDHALIGATMKGTVIDGPAFREGVARSGEGDLTAALFGVRAASVLGLRDDADAAAYVSGLLIGSDCRAQVRVGETVHLLADPALGALYTAAIEALGARAILVDSHAAFLAGIIRIRELQA